MIRSTLLLACLPLLAQDPAVKKGLEYLKTNHEAHLAKQVQIAEIPAPTFHEGERAKFMAAEFRRAGLKNVEIDAQGNVLGWRPGTSPDTIVIAAHLDISFEPGVNTKVRKEGGRWHGPGLADDSRGLVCLLALAEALDHASVQTRLTVLFVANVGEEGLGDLNGVKYLFGQSPHRSRLKAFISVDGTDPGRIVTGGTGVKRYKVSVRGPGGHSYGNFGRPSATHAIGRIISRFTSIDTPSDPKTTYNIGRIGGGTVINAIAEEAWMEVDLRSISPAELDRIELKLMESIRLGLEEENKLRAASGAQVTAETKLIGNRPAGQTPETDPLVRAAMEASRMIGYTPSLVFSSTDSNLPVSLGIPAITMPGGGRSNNAHSLDEWFEPENAWQGPQILLLTLLGYDSQSPAAPSRAKSTGWQSLFDGKSLQGWKRTPFSGGGEVRTEDGTIILQAGAPMTGVTWTESFPKSNYEVRYEGTRLKGGDFFASLTFPAGDSFGTLVLGGWGGDIVGFSSIDGWDASDNETRSYFTFETGRWYTIRLEVTDERIKAWIDQQPAVDINITGRSIGLRPGEIKLSAPFGFASYNTTGAIRNIAYRLLRQ
jgi:tripeptide aminopeptidase